MKKQKNIIILITFFLFFVLSVSANIYSFQQLSEKKEKIIYVEKEKKTEEKTNGEGPISTEKNTVKETTDNEKKINTATRFIEFAFNIDSENYTTRKKNAQLYMTDTLYNRLFAESGIDPDFKSETGNIRVFTTEKTNEVLVIYEVDVDTYETKEMSDLKKKKFTNQSINFVKLKLVEEDAQYKVEALETIKVEERKNNEQND